MRRVALLLFLPTAHAGSAVRNIGRREYDAWRTCLLSGVKDEADRAKGPSAMVQIGAHLGFVNDNDPFKHFSHNVLNETMVEPQPHIYKQLAATVAKATLPGHRIVARRAIPPRLRREAGSRAARHQPGDLDARRRADLPQHQRRVRRQDGLHPQGVQAPLPEAAVRVV